jgi:hypothetical protein
VAALSIVAAACGPRAGDYPFLRTERCGPGCDAGVDAAAPADAGPPEVPPEPLEDWDTTGAGPLTGIWALEISVPARIAAIDVETRQLYRLRVLQRGADVRVRVQPCRIALPSIEGVADLRFGEGALRVIRTKVVDHEGAFLSAADPIGAVLAMPPVAVVVGAELANPDTDPLPTDEMPGLARDEDGDGHPGVTLEANALVCRAPQEAYVALRATVALTGTVTSPDAFDGDVVPSLDQSVLEVSHPCLSVARDLVVEVRPGSGFRARRVGAPEDLDANGNVSCPEISWASAGLFGDYWLTAP